VKFRTATPAFGKFALLFSHCDDQLAPSASLLT
jgi:hypothetical protein